MYVLMPAFVCILPFDFEAAASVLSGYVETGESSTAQDYQEEDNDEDYSYQNYHLRLAQQASPRLGYDLSSFVYNKNYKAADQLDNRARIFKGGMKYDLKKSKEKTLELGIELDYKQKRFFNNPANEYDRIMTSPQLTLEKSHLYAVSISAGVDIFDYLQAGQKDLTKIFVKTAGKRFFLDEKLVLHSGYKLETAQQNKIERERTKHEAQGGIDYVFGLPLIYKFSAQAGWGQRDTKTDEDRDQDLDYTYWRAATQTEHKLGPKLDTVFNFRYFKKDYLAADLGHHGFSIGNDWDYEVWDDEKRKIAFSLGAEHKEVGYPLRQDNDYRKETLELSAGYQRKKNYKVRAAWEENFYDFDDGTNDKRRSFFKIGLEKLFLQKDLILSLDFKFRYTDYQERPNKTQESVRLAFKYGF